MFSRTGFFIAIRQDHSISKVVSFKLLNAHAADVKLLAHFVRFKKAFPNSIVYAYRGSMQNQQNRLKMSRNTIKRTIDLFIEKGWAIRQGEHLILLGKKELGDKYSKKVTADHQPVTINIEKNIVDQLRYHLFNTKINQIKFAQSRQEARSPKLQQKYYLSIRAAYTEISAKTLSTVFSSSKSSAAYIMRKLKKSGYVKSRRSKIRFVSFCRDIRKWVQRKLWWCFKENVNCCFLYNGIIFLKQTTRYRCDHNQAL